MLCRHRSTRTRRPALEFLEDRCAPALLGPPSVLTINPEPMRAGVHETIIIQVAATAPNDDYTGSQMNFGDGTPVIPLNNGTSGIISGPISLGNGDSVSATFVNNAITITFVHTWPQSVAGTDPPTVFTITDKTLNQTTSLGAPGGTGFGQIIQPNTANLAPQITSANNTTFTVNQSGSFTVTTTGTPTPSISKSDTLPSWLTFTDNGKGTGTLTGKPTSATPSSLTLHFTATNGVSPDATQTFTLNIAPAVNMAPKITSGDTVVFKNGVFGSFTITTTGVPPVTNISLIGALPPNVTFHNNGDGTATISGTPDILGLTGQQFFRSILTASNGVAPNAVLPFTIGVLAPPGVVTNAQVVESLAQERFQIAVIVHDEDELAGISQLDLVARAIARHTAQADINTATALVTTISQEIANDPDKAADRVFQDLLTVQQARITALQNRLNTF